MSEEEKQYEKINFTFPVAIDWIIDKYKIPFFKIRDQEILTKSYKVPGSEWIDYYMSFETKIQPGKVFIKFNRYGLYEKTYEWESNLCLTINNGEPKKISQKFKEKDLLLYEGAIEELEKAKKCIWDPVTLRLYGTITVYETSRDEFHDLYDLSSYGFGDLNEPKDFIIEVENQEIHVHKEVLQYFSPVFSAMLQNGWKEASEGRVVIPDFSFETVKKAVGLCYGEENKSYYDTTELILLYRFAEKYDMDEIKDNIKGYIWLTPNNICEYANLFHVENCPIFVSHCIDRLIVYFQFSYHVKDLETLNNDIKNQFFTQASISQAMKKEYMPDFHKSLNNEDCESALF